MKPLAATNRAFHQILQQQVTRLRTNHEHSCTQSQFTETVTLLVRGAWTQLQHLHIDLCDIRQSPESIHGVLQADWPVMNTLDLQRIVLTDDAISLLVARPWPLLSCLHLTKTCLTLLNGEWPVLKSLSLGWNHLHSSFFKWMVEGSRLLHLTELHLPGTQLDEAAISELVHCQASLRTLSFRSTSYLSHDCAESSKVGKS